MAAAQVQGRKQSTGAIFLLLLTAMVMLALIASQKTPRHAGPQGKTPKPTNALWRTRHPAAPQQETVVPIVYLRSV